MISGVIQGRERRLKPQRSRANKNWMLWCLAFPGLLCVFIWNYLPMTGLVMAFQDLDLSKGLFTSPWVGLDNFKYLFASSDAWIITRNTICYNLVFIFFNMVFSVILAVILHELTHRLFAKVSQTVLIMPYFLSAVVVSAIVFAFLSPTDGFINALLKDAGEAPVKWYSKPEVWPYFLVFIYLWQNVGYSSILYSAVLSGIPTEYYEAALIDGATKFQQFRYITLPQLRFVLSINLIRGIGNLFKSGLGMFYTIPRDSGPLFPVTNVLDTYIYRGLKVTNDLGMTTAAGFYQSVVGLILVLIANKIISKIDSESAMF